ILDNLHVPFWATTIIILIMIVLYTFEGGVKTIVYTDTLQTTLMLAGLVICIVYILSNLQLGVGEAFSMMQAKGYTQIFNFDLSSNGYYLKQIIGGAFIAIAMTGLDQEMMQKNISVEKLKDAQKNVITFSTVIVLVNFLFLFLGGLLYIFMLSKQGAYVDHEFIANGKNIIGDDLFPTVALNYFPQAIGIIFIIALISALFPSADGALTALTSSFCIDMLGLQRNENWDEKKRKQIRLLVHASFTIIFFLCILIFKWIGNKSIIYIILDVAGYTYGPLLGLFAFGILTKRFVKDNLLITAICILSPIISWLIKTYSADLFNGYQVGIELLIINGLLTFIGLFLISKKNDSNFKTKD
ncbi:MAG: sodium:solute symporter, partial [Chitinophagaceae bacterium]|nr:sodium:solute symporter [Chitinophagaceae bacterium]